MSVQTIYIRPAIEVDLPQIMKFIRGLAEYEKLSEYVTATEADLRTELFGPRPSSEVFIAEADGQSVGYAWVFTNYSTFRGRRGMYLEDLYVELEYRHCGVGKVILRYLARLCHERGYFQLQWAVLTWNEPALRFYQSLGAAPIDEWVMYALDKEGIEKLANDSARGAAPQ